MGESALQTRAIWESRKAGTTSQYDGSTQPITFEYPYCPLWYSFRNQPAPEGTDRFSLTVRLTYAGQRHAGQAEITCRPREKEPRNGNGQPEPNIGAQRQRTPSLPKVSGPTDEAGPQPECGSLFAPPTASPTMFRTLRS